jgi:hypothetical protein
MRARLQPHAGGLMTLWQRAPREVYRVYGEDEYLAEGEVHAATESRSVPVSEEAHGPRSGRLLGLGLLVGVTVGALGLVVLNVSHRGTAGSRLGVSHRAAEGAVRHTSAPARTSPELAIHGSAAPVSRPGAPSPPMRSAVRPQQVPSTRLTTRQPVGLSLRRRSRAARPSESTPIDASVERGRLWPVMSVPTASEAAVPPADGEFGFEG